MHDMGYDVANKKRVILLTGAGSGGHITPILAVASALKQHDSSVRVVYVGQHGDKLGDIPAGHEHIDEVRSVFSGKLRRYHKQGIKGYFDLKTLAFNIRDAFQTFVGLFQATWLVFRLKPSVVFIKGGFVGVPVGLACALLRRPYVTHDSDSIPGLANRIIAPWARVHAVALPKTVYPYPPEKTVVVGVPVADAYQPVTPALYEKYRGELGIHPKDKVLFVSGGGLGAKAVNDAVLGCVPTLFSHLENVVILHQAGRAHQDGLQKAYKQILTKAQMDRVHVLGYVKDLYRYSAAADLVVTRAGGTTLAELSIQAKPCIVIPHPYLTGGHQIKNARVLDESGAIVAIAQSDITKSEKSLARVVLQLFEDGEKRSSLSSNFARFAQPHATDKLAELILEISNKNIK